MIARAICRRARLRRDRPGQAIVETALVAPILLLLILGVVDFSRAWSAHHTISDAAREATRMLVVWDADIGQDEATAFINNRLATAGLNPDNAVVTYNEGADRGDPTTVTIDYTYRFWLIAGLMRLASGEETVNLVSRLTMRTE